MLLDERPRVWSCQGCSSENWIVRGCWRTNFEVGDTCELLSKPLKEGYIGEYYRAY